MVAQQVLWDEWDEATEWSSIVSAGEADHLEKKYGMIGPKLLRFREKKRRIRHEYCSARDLLQKQQAKELIDLYKNLKLQPFETHRLKHLRWSPGDWASPWWQWWENIAVICVVCWVAFVSWAQDCWVENALSAWLRHRQRFDSQTLYEGYDGELWDLTTQYAVEYGWDSLEDESGYFLRPDAVNVVTSNEWW